MLAGPLVRQHLSELRGIRLRRHERTPEPALPASRLARQDVSLERLTAHELSCRGLLEPLRGSPMCLQLRHDLSFPYDENWRIGDLVNWRPCVNSPTHQFTNSPV